MFNLNPNLKIQPHPIANSNINAFIIDNLLENFETLLDYANDKAYFLPPGSDGTLYPGSRDDMPAPYYDLFASVIKRVFNQSKEQIIAKCWLSKITVKPDELGPLQTMPHYDSLLIEDMAGVHYCNDNSLGGTNFYRYKKLDKLVLEKADEQAILAMLKEHQVANDAKGYINETNSVFKKVDTIEAKPNRLVLYPGNILHSPVVTEQVNFDKKHKQNRTSVNSFFKIF